MRGRNGAPTSWDSKHINATRYHMGWVAAAVVILLVWGIPTLHVWGHIVGTIDGSTDHARSPAFFIAGIAGWIGSVVALGFGAVITLGKAGDRLGVWRWGR